MTGGSIGDSPGLTATTNNNRILTNGPESSAKCMQMSFSLLMYCQHHLWKVGPISIFYPKEAAGNTPVGHCDGVRRRFEENFVTLMPGLVEGLPQCPRFVPVCCALFKVWHFSPPCVFCSASVPITSFTFHTSVSLKCLHLFQTELLDSKRAHVEPRCSTVFSH